MLQTCMGQAFGAFSSIREPIFEVRLMLFRVTTLKVLEITVRKFVDCGIGYVPGKPASKYAGRRAASKQASKQCKQASKYAGGQASSNAMQYNAAQRAARQCNAMQRNAMQCKAAMQCCNAMLEYINVRHCWQYLGFFPHL